MVQSRLGFVHTGDGRFCRSRQNRQYIGDKIDKVDDHVQLWRQNRPRGRFLSPVCTDPVTESQGRGVNPAGDRGKRPPKNVERGDGNTSCPPKYGAYKL